MIGAVFSEEEDAVHNQFAHDASRRPNINFEPVVIASQNQLKKAGKTGSTVSSLDSHPHPKGTELGADIEDFIVVIVRIVIASLVIVIVNIFVIML